ncbi:hypothetical protein C8A05DRAFT_13137 [Staphylotrichum tortipilum]|uniref:Uncharacterized protein n=1 Tax=Staphylotrichum tortipilum TaxID=2831512 RepID=A0AAN6RWT4_9PEZI|nr:hypothetical protein C8A05DRAFT_13137 [Staphylotrichum longicolle]
MASIIARRAFTTSARRLATSEEALKAETKKNPEIMILGGVMVCALAGAGFYFGRSPTTSTSENTVPLTGMPWETGSTQGKYQYFPGGDSSAAPKDAPSAVNVVVVPDVDLPKRLHDKYNKWGKEGY